MPNVEVEAARASSGHEPELPIWVRIWPASCPVTCLSLPLGSSLREVHCFLQGLGTSLGSSGDRGSGLRSLRHRQTEQRRNITVVQHPLCSGRCFAQSNILSGNGEQFIFIHSSQHEEKLGLFV